MTTVTDASITLSQRLNDPVSSGTSDGQRYTADLRLSALNTATRLIVALLTKINTSQLETFREEVTQAIGASGLNKTALPKYMSMISLDVNIDIQWIPAEPKADVEIEMGNNYWVSGTSFAPKYWFSGNELKIEVDIDDYPVNCKILYAREPKNLVYVATGSTDDSADIELNSSLEEAMYSFAMWHCALQGNDDFANSYYANGMSLLQFGRIKEDSKQ